MSNMKVNNKNIASYLESDSLDSIRNITLNMVLWKRKPKPVTLKFLKNLSEKHKLNLVTENTDLNSLLEKIPAPKDKQLFIGYENFLADIKYLSDSYKSATGFEKFYIRLQSVKEIQCPKFHRDFTNFRLVCTYFGAGMEWIPDELADDLDSKEESELKSITRKLNPFDVSIFKGVKKETAQVGALIHRSPHVHNPINRIFLRIDTMK